MPLLTRAVFGFVYRADGTAIAAAPVSIRSFAAVFQPDGSVAPATLLTPITNSVGRYDVVLVANARYLIGIPGDVFEISVPSGVGSVSVESLRATTGVVMTNAIQLLLDAKENALGTPDIVGKFLTSTVGGGRSWAVTPVGGAVGAAGGVLGGNYPNPSFAVDMATQADIGRGAPLYSTTNLSHDFRLDGTLINTRAAVPAVFLGPRTWVNPWRGTGVRADNGNGAILLPTSFAHAASRTLYFVVRVPTLQGGFPYVLSETTTVSNKGIELLLNSPGDQWQIRLGDAAFSLPANASGTFTINSWYCLALKFIAGTGLYLYQNGATLIATVTSTKIPVATQSMIGGYVETGNGFTSGYATVDMGLALQYSVAHSDSDINAVYAAIKTTMAVRGVVLP